MRTHASKVANVNKLAVAGASKMQRVMPGGGTKTMEATWIKRDELQDTQGLAGTLLQCAFGGKKEKKT